MSTRLTSKDLMIGDWVKFDNLRDGTEFIKVGLRTLFNMTDSEYLCSYIEPILITKEILEKNGFEWKYVTPDYGEYKSKDRRIILYEGVSNTIGKDWYCYIDNESFETIGGADIQYVHELQHLFNLCGIEKEIEL